MKMAYEPPTIEERAIHLKKFMDDYHILVFTPEEQELIGQLDNCINCGTCTMYCPLLIPTKGELSPQKIAIEVSRTEPYWKTVRNVVYECTNCGKCEEVCPKSIPVPLIVRIVRQKIYEQSPESIPEGYKGLENNLKTYQKAFMPIDEDDKQDYIEDESENLGIPNQVDVYKDDAEVYYFMGCQASERMFKIREATKFILKKFDVNYSLIKDESCCGLPAVLLGNPEIADNFCNDLLTNLQKTKIKTLICTCAGCAARLKEFFFKIDVNFEVKHFVEYLVEDITLDKIKEKITGPSEKMKITLHNPCDLHRGIGKYFIDYTESILKIIPNVEFTRLENHDECCGSGGLADVYIPEVTKELQEKKINDIEKISVNKVISACPRCLSQIEEGIHAKSSKLEAEDITTFLLHFLGGLHG